MKSGGWNVLIDSMACGQWLFLIMKTMKYFFLETGLGLSRFSNSHIGDVFAFASETNCFKNLEGYHRSFNHSVLNQALHNPYYANSINSSIFNGIEQLPAGCVMRIDTHGLSTTERYYSFEASCAEQSDQPYNEGEFRELFIDSVRLRLRSDVPIATAFSGGLDSTAVYSTIKHLANNPESISRLPSKWQNSFLYGNARR